MDDGDAPAMQGRLLCSLGAVVEVGQPVQADDVLDLLVRAVGFVWVRHAEQDSEGQGAGDGGRRRKEVVHEGEKKLQLCKTLKSITNFSISFIL